MSDRVNVVTIGGLVGADPVVRVTGASRLKVANITLANHYATKRGEEGTNWIRVVAWASQADVAETYIRTGRELVVVGRLREHSYEARCKHCNGPNKTTVAEVWASELHMGSREGRQSLGQAPETAVRVADAVSELGGDTAPF